MGFDDSSFKDSKNSAFSRRQVLVGGAVGAVGVAAMLASPRRVLAAPTTLTIPNSGGVLEAAFKTAYFDTFQAQTGIGIISAPYMDASRIKAMVDNKAVDVDVINVDSVEAATMARMGLLEPIDYDIVDKSVLIPSAVHEYYLLADVAALVMAWSTRSFNAQNRPASWAQYFDAKKMPGMRSAWKMASQTMEIAALGGGQDPAKLYPLNLDLAFATLDKVKKNNLTWWTSGAQSAQLLVDGEIDLGTAWNGRVYKPKLDGAAIDYTYDQALYSSDAMVIPKGARNKKASMQFLAHMMEAKHQAAFSTLIPYGPVNSTAFDLLSPETLKLLPNSPENGKTGIYQDANYWAENGEAVLARFNNWLVS